MKTTNQIEIGLSLQRASDLYTCHEQIPKWSPGFISLETVKSVDGGVGNVYRLRYSVNGKEIDELLTLLALDLPNSYRVRSNHKDLFYRESAIEFHAIDESTTKLTVHNEFSGEYLPHLVHEELQGYTQMYLETFKAFAERHNEN